VQNSTAARAADPGPVSDFPGRAGADTPRRAWPAPNGWGGAHRLWGAEGFGGTGPGTDPGKDNLTPENKKKPTIPETDHALNQGAV